MSSKTVAAVSVIMTVLLTMAATSSSTLYYIIPTPTTECPGLPCFTLSDYATYRSQNNSTTTESVILFFLVGPHTLKDRGIIVQNVASFTMMGDPTDLPILESVITCSSRSGSILGFDFYNVTNVVLSSLVFTGCGHETLLSVLFYIDSVSLFTVKSCVFQDNGYTSAIFLKSSSGYISDSTFANNTALYYGAALWTYNSRVDIIGSNCFIDNMALRRCGVIDAERSVIIFNSSSWGNLPYYSRQDSRCLPGTTTIVDNSVNISENDTRNNCCGGAVCMLDNSELTVHGTSIWAGNVMFPPLDQYLSSPYWGGALFVEYSFANFDGNHTFTDNTAGVGGAIYVRYSIFGTKGKFKLENNSAFLGGAMYVSTTLYRGEGTILYNGNFGNDNNGTILIRGGSVFFAESVVCFDGSVTVHNSFAHVGGGMLLSYSSVTFFRKFDIHC